MTFDDDIETGAQLRWDPGTGFELDLVATSEGVTVRMVSIPVNADGTDELAGGVELHRLEILFKADVDVDGAAGQLLDASIQLVAKDRLKIEARVEDAETGDVIPFEAEVPAVVSSRAPAAGGPRPPAVEEEELDWEDETTLEVMLGDVMPMSTGEIRRSQVEKLTAGQPKGPSGGGYAALLKALHGVNGDDEGEDDEAPSLEALGLARETAAPVAPKVDSEALAFLELLVEQDALELAEDGTLEALAPGIAPILRLQMSPERKASTISSWLLDQSEVEELYIDDEDLEELLARW